MTTVVGFTTNYFFYLSESYRILQSNFESVKAFTELKSDIITKLQVITFSNCTCSSQIKVFHMGCSYSTHFTERHTKHRTRLDLIAPITVLSYKTDLVQIKYASHAVYMQLYTDMMLDLQCGGKSAPQRPEPLISGDLNKCILKKIELIMNVSLQNFSK